MKKLLILAALAGIFACTPKHDGYTIKGTITGDSITATKVFMANTSRIVPIMDTAELVDGKFVFEGKVTTPEYYIITVEGIKDKLKIFVENEEYTIEAAIEEFGKAVVTGGTTNSLLKEMDKQKDEIYTKFGMDSLMNEYYKKETTPERRKEISNVYMEAQKEAEKLDSAFYAVNPVSPYTLIQNLQNIENFTIEEAEAKLATFKALPEFAENRFIADFENAIATIKTLQPGLKAPDFTLNDPQGNPVVFSEVYPKNKITMIDFWASWCGPCRNFNPALVEIYKKYNKAGLGIIGVSLDKDAESWNKAIADDNLTWGQVSDLKFWDCAVAKLYYIRYIPQNVFVDQQGNIIKRKVEGKELESFIKEQLGIK
jgi:thiol-disulfide isomerase/thioredoxin